MEINIRDLVRGWREEMYPDQEIWLGEWGDSKQTLREILRAALGEERMEEIDPALDEAWERGAEKWERRFEVVELGPKRLEDIVVVCLPGDLPKAKELLYWTAYQQEQEHDRG